MAEIFKFPGSSPTRGKAVEIAEAHDKEERWRSRPYTRRGPNMHTFLFRSRAAAIVAALLSTRGQE